MPARMERNNLPKPGIWYVSTVDHGAPSDAPDSILERTTEQDVRELMAVRNPTAIIPLVV